MSTRPSLGRLSRQPAETNEASRFQALLGTEIAVALGLTDCRTVKGPAAIKAPTRRTVFEIAGSLVCGRCAKAHYPAFLCLIRLEAFFAVRLVCATRFGAAAPP